MSSDNIIFIDANIYLELFTFVEGSKVEKVFESLNDLKDEVFITKQIVDETNRNKLKKVLELLTTQLKLFLINEFSFPDHLFAQDNDEIKKLRKELSSLKKDINKIKNSRLDKALLTLEEVSLSKDRISKKLETLFKEALSETPADIRRARLRKEKGNPPGKEEDPFGDQLNWEQLINYSVEKKKKKIWIITKDQDFFSQLGKKVFLNPMLNAELIKCGFQEIFCFQDLLEGLQDFSNKTGQLRGKLPNKKQAETIRETIRQNNIYDQVGEFLNASNQGVLSSLAVAPTMARYNSPNYLKIASQQYGVNDFLKRHNYLELQTQQMALQELLKKTPVDELGEQLKLVQDITNNQSLKEALDFVRDQKNKK